MPFFPAVAHPTWAFPQWEPPECCWDGDHRSGVSACDSVSMSCFKVALIDRTPAGGRDGPASPPDDRRSPDPELSPRIAGCGARFASLLSQPKPAGAFA